MPTSLAASKEAEALARAYTDVFIELERTKAQMVFLENDLRQLSAASLAPENFAGYHNLDTIATKALDELLRGSIAPILKNLSSSVAEQESDLADLKKEWTAVKAQKYQAEIELAEVGAAETAAGRLAAIISLDNRWFLLSALFAISVFTFVAWHERRHEYRRSVNGGLGRALGIARILRMLFYAGAVLTIVFLVFGDRIHDALVGIGASGARSRADIAQEIDTKTSELEVLGTTLSNARLDAKKSISKWIANGVVGDAWLPSRQIMENLVGLLEAKLSVSENLSEDLDELMSLEERRHQLVDSIVRHRHRNQLIRVAMCSSLAVVTVLLAAPVLRGIRTRRREIAETCPLCLGIGTLEPESGSDGPAGSFVRLRCRRELDSLNEECGFSFLSVYREMPKLCFPTLGHTESGKTHWLTMVYRELNQGQGTVGDRIRFQKVKSAQSEDFDRLVDEIINARLNTSATQVGRIPYPLLFNFTDNDRWGRSNILLNIFDYSGEVTKSMSLDDPQRRRMLDADGYIFFLDPTKRSEEQAKELVDFAEDVQVIKGAKVGQSLQVPVALCVSKIDLLVNQDYADPGRDGEVGHFYQELSKCDTGKSISLDAMTVRSRLMQELRHTIWPGWEIEQQIDQLFGGRYMYFPLTPVGLNELGVTDLSHRTIAPCWILEPLLWLLDMNGYPVFR